MTVYVDELKHYPSHVESGQRTYVNREWCHMTADTHFELIDMAMKIGMKREWLQNHGRVIHFDLMEKKRNLALECGAVFKSAREQARERIKKYDNNNRL